MTVTPLIVYFYCLAKHATSQVLQAKTVSKHYTCLGNGSSGVVVLGTRVLKVVGSSPCTTHWMDIFIVNLLLKLY